MISGAAAQIWCKNFSERNKIVNVNNTETTEN
jgi:hypothetical protein